MDRLIFKILAACLSLPLPVLAQDQSEILEEVVVTATRVPADLSELPFAASRVGGEKVQRARQQLGLDESLVAVPGLFFQNRYNFAQDLRIAIRGFGARANFGIRGIRVFSDDVPLTLPDGQGSVDAIDLGSIERIEVIRGPFSAVYGSASGGVINLHTESGPDVPYISARLNAGAHGFGQAQLKAGGQARRLNWLANLSATKLTGYRDHAEYENALLNTKLRYELDDSTKLTVVFNAIDSPLANDPGALNKGEVAENRRQAAPRNVLYDAGEALDQQTLGLALRKTLASGNELMLRTYRVNRSFRNRLPFDVNSNGQGGGINLQRKFAGLGGNYNWNLEWGSMRNLLVIGFDHDAQRDHRRRFANNRGILGPVTTSQDEDVTTSGIYIQDTLQFRTGVNLTLGGRFDDVEYEVKDRIGTANSGQRDFREFSPMAGFNWGLRDSINLYGNVSTSFDPPATAELANPDGPGGFNRELDSQKASNYEIGVKGLLTGRLRYELALFHINVEDEIVPYELEGSGQSFFENAGSSTHDGVEMSLVMELLPGFTGTVSYTWSDFIFETFFGNDGDDYSGNRIPGIPEHLFNLDLDWTRGPGIYAGLNFLYAGPFYANNANTVKTGSYLLSNFRFGYRWERGRWAIEPFAGVNNLLDEAYMSNVRLNASFGRYYEPAPGRNAYAGAMLQYGFD
jgi:iron complex outermembrane receptor protein